MFRFLKKKFFVHRNVKLANEKLAQIEEFHSKHGGGLIGYLSGYEQYQIFADCVNPDCKPVMDTGNWENAAMQEYWWLLEQIKKHPILWSFFQL